MGKNSVGNNSVVKVFRPRFPGQVFSRYFLYPIYSLFWIYHRARKSYISFSFLRFSMHEESTQLLLSLLLYPENVCHPTTFSLQNLQESQEKKRHEQFVMLQPPFPSFFYFPGGFFVSVLIGWRKELICILKK